MIKIENWSIVQKPASPYLPPEYNRSYLQGIVYGHPDKTDGSLVITSRIVLSHKIIVATQSGHLYRLGRPNKNYLSWLDSLGYEFDFNEPLKLIGPHSEEYVTEDDHELPENDSVINRL